MLNRIVLLLAILGGLNLKRVSFTLSKIHKPSDLLHDGDSEGAESPAHLSKSIYFDIINNQNLQYYGPLEIGSSRVRMNFVFDTGSNELWFPTTQCSSCQAGSIRYDTSSSSFYHQTSSQLSEINYGRGHVEGYKSQDQVWFSDTAKIDQMPCLSVTKQSDLNGIAAEGILGLAPLDQAGQPPFLLDVMLKNELIDKRVLSFAYHKTSKQTKLVFGEPDYSMVESRSVEASIPLVAQGILYFVQIFKSEIGGTTLSSSNQQAALIDTGTSFLQIPRSAFNNLVSFYRKEGASFLDCAPMTCATCSSLSKESLVVTLGDHKFNVPFSELWIQEQNQCLLGAFPSDSSEWILGDVFIRNFFFVIDYDQGDITIIGENISEAGRSILGWIIFGVIVLVVIVVIGICCYCKRKKTRESQRAPNSESLLIQNHRGVRLGSSVQNHRVNSSFQQEI